MPTAAPSGYKLERKWSLTHFLIGVFGAMAILGVMAKIFNFQTEMFGYLITWKQVVLVGFMGEAIVFILMGMLREMQYVAVDEDAPEATGLGEDAHSSDLKEAEETLTQETERLAEQVKSAHESLEEQVRAMEELSMLREHLQQASESLSEQSGVLESNMEDLQTLYEAQIPMTRSVEEIQQKLAEESEELSNEIAETRKAMKALRTQFAQTARRFEQFNEPSSVADRTNDTPHST